MGWCSKIFKIAVICMLLVSFGLGYLKLYQLFVDIKDTLSSIGEVSSIKDLAWIPFLVLQVSTTVFIFLQIYCLIRELCEDNYMYKHCFRLAFILTVLIYGISIVPKSILTIIYQNYDVTVQEWWNKVVNVFESLFSNLGTLGFQIILYMRIIRRTLRSAGVFKKHIVVPLSANMKKEIDSDDDVDRTGCCLFNKRKTSDNAIPSDQKTSPTAIRNNNGAQKVMQKKKKIENNVHNISTWRDKKENEIKILANKKKEAAITKVKNDSRTKHLMDKKRKGETTLNQAKTSSKQTAGNLTKYTKWTRNTNIASRDVADVYCSKCGFLNSRTIAMVENEYRMKASEKEYSETCCRQCGTVLNYQDNISVPQSRISICCKKCEEKLCCLCENRTTCFIITMALANFHMLVYVIELFFIFCPWCK